MNKGLDMTTAMNIGKLLTMLFVVFGLMTPSAKAEGMAEILGKAQELSSNIGALGSMGKSKISNPKVEEYNTQMQQNNSLTQKALSQVAKQLNIDVPTSKTDLATKGLEGLKGAAFEQSFLNKGVGLQSQLLDLVKSKLHPGLSSPIAAGVLKSFTPGLSDLVEKGKTLQNVLGK